MSISLFTINISVCASPLSVLSPISNTIVVQGCKCLESGIYINNNKTLQDFVRENAFLRVLLKNVNNEGGVVSVWVNINLKEIFSPWHCVRGSLSATLEGWDECSGDEKWEYFSGSIFFTPKNICLQLFYWSTPSNMD